MVMFSWFTSGSHDAPARPLGEATAENSPLLTRMPLSVRRMMVRCSSFTTASTVSRSRPGLTAIISEMTRSKSAVPLDTNTNRLSPTSLVSGLSTLCTLSVYLISSLMIHLFF